MYNTIWIQYKSPQLKKRMKPKQNFKEQVAYICINKYCFQMNLYIYFSYLDVYQLYEEHLSKHIIDGKSNHS
jgi:hypothetical protein